MGQNGRNKMTKDQGNLMGHFAKAFGQLGDPAILSILLKSALICVAGILVLASTVGLGVYGLIDTFGDGLASLFGLDDESSLAALFSVVAFLVAGFFVMTFYLPLTAFTASLFLDDVAAAVERRHYPSLGTLPDASFLKGLHMAMRLTAMLVLVNILLIPVYFLSGPVSFVIFTLVNGYLVGREYFEQSALRYGFVRRQDIASLRVRVHPGPLVVGLVFVLIASIPFLNLLLPVIATMVMTHLVVPATSKI